MPVPMKAPHILGAFVPNGRASCSDSEGDEVVGDERYSLQSGRGAQHDEEIYIHQNRVIWSIGRQVFEHHLTLTAK